MIGIIGDLKSIFDLWNGRAPSMDFFFAPPAEQAVPDVAMKKLYSSQTYSLSKLGVHNLSRRVIKTIRIKLAFAPKLPPKITGHDVRYDASRAELTVSTLDPDSWFVVDFFLVDEEKDRFREPQVLVEDRLMSRFVRGMTIIRPDLKLYIFVCSALLLSVFCLGAFAYKLVAASPLNPRVKAVQDAFDSSEGCVPTGYSNEEATREVLGRHQFGEAFLLSLNKVATRDELMAKSYIVVCEKRPPSLLGRLRQMF